jgi:hypothetical protein
VVGILEAVAMGGDVGILVCPLLKVMFCIRGQVGGEQDRQSLILRTQQRRKRLMPILSVLSSIPSFPTLSDI